MPHLRHIRRFVVPNRAAITNCVLGVLLIFTFSRMARLSGWDDGYYVAQLVSLAQDHDLLLHDELLALSNPVDLKLRMLLTVRSDGALHNPFSIGPATAHAAYMWPVIKFAGLTEVRAGLALGSMAILILAVLVMTSLVANYGEGPGRALGAAILAIALGPMAVYGTRDYLGSHLLSTLWVAVFLRSVLAWSRSGSAVDALLTGAAAGL